ncbi:5'-3' exoribonuclease 1 isoform X2 [Wyeomyia smithii]|uniref:5'-3' exoribonuclease 1 isoform X2 n=1 Tax=Wyeomyia smithii TaxID=174621 RepID=UPI002467F210|nr:5'-3' exoribonuclease 1 isoform X2 [Wyeomyia smithii]
MGVPKFFRYISERYPCLSELIRENQVPEFDNLYLDMNGIIHNCSHPNDSDVFFRITEEKIFSDIFHYLEFLFRMIRPRKLFFLAVDGVAPRAKMNQQRGRRFRSAREAQEQAEQAEKKGHVLPTEARFDSNCITPGTSFMARLQKAMEHFIKIKVSTNPLWKHCKVILSGHETPGEGEHKIMEYIRYLKASPGFDPNTRHCLYGLDADLVMLGLCTHEKHFSLLREEVKFGKNEKKSSIVEETRFYLLHLTLMSEYLELEFAPVRDKLSFEFDINKLIDDWVLMGYMVGNDFIPHLPHLHINENALPTLFQAYMDVLPSLDGYINEGGILNLPRLEVFMERLSKFDRDIFLEHYTDLQYFKSKRGPDNMEAFDVTLEEIKAELETNYDLSQLIQATEDMFLDDDEEPKTPGDIENDPEFFEKEFAAYKRNYYITKMGYHEFNNEVRAEQAECYIRALQWTLLYYYRGVPSWAWFYPHHYAPFISDVHDFKHLAVNFNLGKPFLPFQQLLSVLPAASKQHLPSAYHDLMTDPASPVFDFYPANFDTDLNGKQQSWEAVVLIPFIDEKRLLNAMEPCDAFLTDEEKERNVHGPMLLFQYDSSGSALLAANYGFDDVEQLKVKEILIYREDLHVSSDKLVLGPSKGAILDGYVKGFPTMRHLQYHGLLKELRIKVFNYPSRNPSMIVVLDRPQNSAKPTQQVAQDLLGRIVYVSWPHLNEAKVVKVTDATMIYEKGQQPRENNAKFFEGCVRSIVDHHSNRLGIDLGKIDQLVHVRTCVGTEYVLRDDRYVLNKLWNNGESMYPIQAVVTDLREVLKTLKPYQELNEMFPEDCLVFLRGTQFYGSMGRIVDVTAGHKRIKTRFEVYAEPNLTKVIDVNDRVKNHYLNTQDAASMIGISLNLLNRLSSTILIMPGSRRSVQADERGKMNIGLQLRMHTQNEETVGYTKKTNKTWMYSEKAIQLIKDYYEKVPHLFGRLEHFGKYDNLFEDEMFGENKDDGISLKELMAWISSQDHVKAEKRSCGTKMLEPPALEELLKVIDDCQCRHPVLHTMFVHAKYLFKPGMKQAKIIDHQANFELLDRVIVAKDTEVVPLGYRGSIIGIHYARDPNPVRQESVSKDDMYLDILFDKEFHNGVKIFGLEKTNNRVVRLAEGAVLNITFGRAEVEYKPVDPSQPIMLPAEEFLSAGRANLKQQQKYEAVRIAPSKPPPTAESIKRRLSERIEKKNPMKAFIMANQKPREDSEQNLQTTCDFELTWNKLRETVQASCTSEKRDIKSFLVKSSSKPNEEQETIVDGDQAGVDLEDNNNALQKVTEDPTNMLKLILKINNSETDQNNSTVMNDITKTNDFNISSRTLEKCSALPHQINIPTPKNLPKPPKSWRSPVEKLCKTQSVKETQHADSVSATAHPLPLTQGNQPPARHIPPHSYQQPFVQMRPYRPHVMMLPTNPPPFRGFLPQCQPMPRYQRNAPVFMHPVLPQQQYLPQKQQIYRTPPPPPFVPRQHGPNGPQNLSFNRNTPAGTGAFVPLQAIINAKTRNNTGNTSNKQTNNHQQRPKQQQPPPPPPVSNTTVFAKQNAELRQAVEQKHEEATQGFASFLAAAQTPAVELPLKVDEAKSVTQATSKPTETSKTIKSYAQQPRPRPMRIAAKFSQIEQNSN